jgi:hypothetical protein
VGYEVRYSFVMERYLDWLNWMSDRQSQVFVVVDDSFIFIDCTFCSLFYFYVCNLLLSFFNLVHFFYCTNFPVRLSFSNVFLFQNKVVS